MAEEVVENVNVEFTLGVTERGLLKQGILALCYYCQNLGVGNCETELLGFFLDNLVLQILVPNLVFELVVLGLAQGGVATSKLNYARVLLEHLLELGCCNFFTVYASNGL